MVTRNIHPLPSEDPTMETDHVSRVRPLPDDAIRLTFTQAPLTVLAATHLTIASLAGHRAFAEVVGHVPPEVRL